MKPNRLFIILALAIFVSSVSAQETNSSEPLTQMVGQLQKSPTDRALREKIIKLALELQPAPTVPPEAKRPFVMGVTYQKEAKSPEDFGLAIKAFQDASAAAPWWGDAYYNLSLSLESAKRYDEAKDALTLYLLTKPTDAEQAQERLYALDAKKVLAVKQAEAKKIEEARIAKAAEAEKERLRPTVEGKWSSSSVQFQVVRNGERFTVISVRVLGQNGYAKKVVIDQKHVRFTAVYSNESIQDLTLSDNGNELIGNSGTNEGAKFERLP